MIVKTVRTALVLASLSFAATANAGVINLVSGQGTIGGTDSAVKMLVGPTSGDFPTTPSFDVSTYQSAFVANPNPNSWVHPSSTPALGAAQWDVTSVQSNGNPGTLGNTAIYAISIGPVGSVLSATLGGVYAVDNSINHIWVGNGSGTVTEITPSGFVSGSFGAITTLSSIDITSYLSATGPNYLYIEGYNTDGPSGLVFNLSVNTSVPEPSSLAMVAIAGLSGLGFYARRKRSIA